MNNMQIKSNTQNSNLYINQKRNEEDEKKSSLKLASGNRLAQASTDAASLAISQILTAQMGGMEQASRNSQDGISLVQTAEGGLSQTSDMLNRARELAVQAGSDTLTDSDKAILNFEFTQISEAINDIANRTQFNGKKLLDGSNTELNIQTGANAGDNMTLDLSGANVSNLNVVSGDLNLATGNIDDILKAIDADIDSISSGRAGLGAQENVLGNTINSLDKSSVNLASANSSLADTDMAKEVSNLNKASVLRAAQMNMLMQETVQQESVMKILG